jgi:hypothetical protein
MTHQLFCNSCKFGQISSPYDIYCKEKTIAKYSPYYGRKLSQETIQFLQTCGCASHSDFQREGLLDMIKRKSYLASTGDCRGYHRIIDIEDVQSITELWSE